MGALVTSSPEACLSCLVILSCPHDWGQGEFWKDVKGNGAVVYEVVCVCACLIILRYSLYIINFIPFRYTTQGPLVNLLSHAIR